MCAGCAERAGCVCTVFRCGPSGFRVCICPPVKRLCVGPRHGGTITKTDNRRGITVECQNVDLTLILILILVPIISFRHTDAADVCVSLTSGSCFLLMSDYIPVFALWGGVMDGIFLGGDRAGGRWGCGGF